ncbi:MAG: hypothetical protein HY722_05765 [Planctomycetes bacterium]|nr:hypothetical protein [Planctomycetota bacterium]
MAIRNECSSCQTVLSAPDDLEGKTVKCPQCGTRNTVLTEADARRIVELEAEKARLEEQRLKDMERLRLLEHLEGRQRLRSAETLPAPPQFVATAEPPAGPAPQGAAFASAPGGPLPAADGPVEGPFTLAPNAPTPPSTPLPPVSVAVRPPPPAASRADGAARFREVGHVVLLFAYLTALLALSGALSPFLAPEGKTDYVILAGGLTVAVALFILLKFLAEAAGVLADVLDRLERMARAIEELRSRR